MPYYADIMKRQRWRCVLARYYSAVMSDARLMLLLAYAADGYCLLPLCCHCRPTPPPSFADVTGSPPERHAADAFSPPLMPDFDTRRCRRRHYAAIRRHCRHCFRYALIMIYITLSIIFRRR